MGQTGYCPPLLSLARFWRDVRRSLDAGESHGVLDTAHTSQAASPTPNQRIKRVPITVASPPRECLATAYKRERPAHVMQGAYRTNTLRVLLDGPPTVRTAIARPH